MYFSSTSSTFLGAINVYSNMHLGRDMCLPRETGICICCNEDLSLWQGYTFEVVMYPVPQFFPWALGVQTCYSRQHHVDNFTADDFCHFVRENKMYSHLLLVPPHSSVVLHFLLKQTEFYWMKSAYGHQNALRFPTPLLPGWAVPALSPQAQPVRMESAAFSTGRLNQPSLILIISSWITHSLVFCTLRCLLWHGSYL